MSPKPTRSRKPKQSAQPPRRRTRRADKTGALDTQPPPHAGRRRAPAQSKPKGAARSRQAPRRRKKRRARRTATRTSPAPTIALAPIVHVVDDDPAMRTSLRWLIESVHLGVQTYRNAQEFLDTYERKRPGCLVLDVRMPGMSGLELQAKLSAKKIHIPTLVITGYAEVPLAVRAMKSGAIDFIEKPFSDQHLLDRIGAAIELDGIVRRKQAERTHARQLLKRLTVREREVMERVVAGKANKAIAMELRVSSKTVEAHRSHLMEKLKADSLADLIRLRMLAAEDRENPYPKR